VLSPDHRVVFWVSGPLRCILISTSNPDRHEVVVFDSDTQILTERCHDPEDAAQIAERLRKALVEPRP
jgi:hypothetical protein